MKKISFILITSLALFGCSQSSTKSTPVAEAPQLTQEQQDSVARYNKYKATMNVAFGKITFGITKKEFDRLTPTKVVVVGNSSYNIDAGFTTKTNLLYTVVLTSDLKSANYIDTELSEGMDNIVSVITAKYGPPTSDIGKIKFFNFKPGYYQFVKEWNLYAKKIYIGMSEAESGYEYQVACKIVNTKMQQEEDDLEAKKTEHKTLADTSKF